MQGYRKLLVWQKGHQLAIDTYERPRYLLKPEAAAGSGFSRRDFNSV